MNGLKETLEFIVKMAKAEEKTEIIDINGRTFVNKHLIECSKCRKAEPINGHTLTSLVDYIEKMGNEFLGQMFIHIVSPTKVRLISTLNNERSRECLFEATAQTSEFAFDTWYDQEQFVIELQSNFQRNEDLNAILKVSGNVEAKTVANYGDDGCTQKTTISQGIAAKVDVIVPNPVVLIPYRTFSEVKQPESNFVFRISSQGNPMFKLIEANGGIWKNEAINNIKDYLSRSLSSRNLLPIIG